MAKVDELFAIERIALAQQSILRAARFEAGLFTTCLNEALDPTGEPINPMTQELVDDVQIVREQNRNYILAEGFHRMAKSANSWSLFLRYQAQAERHYRRAIEEFERLRALRPELPNEPTAPSQIPIPTQTSILSRDSNGAVPNRPDEANGFIRSEVPSSTQKSSRQSSTMVVDSLLHGQARSSPRHS